MQNPSIDRANEALETTRNYNKQELPNDNGKFKPDTDVSPLTSRQRNRFVNASQQILIREALEDAAEDGDNDILFLLLDAEVE